MSEIIVEVREVHIQKVKVEVENYEHAFELVASGCGEEIGETIYTNTLDPITWTIGEKLEVTYTECPTYLNHNAYSCGVSWKKDSIPPMCAGCPKMEPLSCLGSDNI